MSFTADVELEAAGRGITGSAGVAGESVGKGASVVVNDGRAEVVAVAQGGATDAAGDGVDGLDAGLALVGAAGTLRIGIELVEERLVDFLGLIESGRCV